MGVNMKIECILGIGKVLLSTGHFIETEKLIGSCLEHVKLNKEPSIKKGQEKNITNLAGDLYFILGVFYYQEHYLTKSEHCFILS